MRLLTLAALVFAAFVGTMTVEPTDANAVVCARGVVRAGCVAARPACRWVVVNGARVRRCV